MNLLRKISRTLSGIVLNFIKAIDPLKHDIRFVEDNWENFNGMLPV